MVLGKTARATFALTCCVLSALLVSSHCAKAADRVALVIGNGAYQNTITLPNPPRDAAAMAALLRGLDFEVIEGEDLTKSELDAKLRQFASAAERAKVTLVFYAGHGMQVNGKNYVIPIDAKLADAAAVDFETVNVDRIITYARHDDGVAIVLLDACRDNPLSRRFARSFVASRSANVGQGLALPSVAGGGVLIGFATAPGEEASDGAGTHSPFTAALLRNLAVPGLEIQQALTRVKADVYASTKGAQEPWHNSSLRTEFYLKAASPVVGTNSGPAAPPEEALWQKLASSGDVAALRLYIDAYPTSPHVDEAKTRLAALAKNEKFSVVFSGNLAAADSKTYFSFRDTTATREGPGSQYASRFSLKPDESVRALGQVTSDDDKVWVEVATADGNQGFAVLEDLLSPVQFEKRRRLLHQKEQLQSLFERAKKSWGPLGSTAGIWTFAKKCVEPVDGALHINLGLAIFSRWLQWDEGDTYYRVNIMRPDLIHTYALRRQRVVSLNASGRVQMYQFKYDTGVDLIGFKGDQGFYHKSGNNYGIMNRCGSIDAEKYHVMELWATWVGDEQRRPDKN
jgi:hypothetical protein